MTKQITTTIGTTQYWIALCRWCGYTHSGVCPRVKAIEYFPDGAVKRVELHDSAFRHILKMPRITVTEDAP